ncbi:ATP phosphoribosyltransferase [Candidatus Micrarchaeota archaeon]|nr:ATP phosphoribosyltransferase [Candidatus Micrarchaeota archaeon]
MLRLALPNKGRLCSGILQLLDKIGLKIPQNGRKLFVNTSNPDIQIVYARAADIPLYVQSGVADIGIVGEDMIREKGAVVENLLKLNFGGCKIAVAAPKNSKVTSPENYKNGLRVATKLVNIATEYFRSTGKLELVEIVPLSGAIELAPNLGIADVIVDQVETGSTLSANNLEIIDTIFVSELYLVANKQSLVSKFDQIDEIKVSMESVITAEDKRYVMANVKSIEVLKKVISSASSLESPTVLNLAKDGEYAVHTVVESSELIPTIRKMKQAGATGILVMNMSRVVQ